MLLSGYSRLNTQHHSWRVQGGGRERPNGMPGLSLDHQEQAYALPAGLSLWPLNRHI